MKVQVVATVRFVVEAVPPVIKEYYPVVELKDMPKSRQRQLVKFYQVRDGHIKGKIGSVSSWTRGFNNYLRDSRY